MALAALWLACGAVCAQAGPPQLHLLMVGDTNDPQIGTSVNADLEHLGDVFTYNVPPRHLRTTELSGGQVGAQRILAVIRSLRIEAGQDTVVFYYSGHGGYDRNASEHVFYPGRRLLSSKEVRATLQQLNPRLIVILADTCSEFRVSPVPAPAFPPATRVSPLFKSLFFDPSGLIVISSTKPGQLAGGNSAGGFFTWTLLAYFLQNRTRTVTWENTLRQVNQQVAAEYADADQTAYIVTRVPGSSGPLALDAGTDDGPGDDGGTPPGADDPSPGGAQAIRFGVSAQRTPRSARLGGVEVTMVMPGYPGTSIRDAEDGKQYYLVPGRDMITHVNGQRVASHEEFRQAVEKSPARMTVRVHDLQTGEAKDYLVDLASSGSPGGPRFGVTAQRTPRSAQVGGVEVTLVMPGYPGTSIIGHADGKQYYLVAGRDIITHINQQPVTSYDEFRRAVADSPRQMTIRVYDLSTRSAADYGVQFRGGAEH